MIRFRKTSYTYDGKNPALREVTLSVSEGEFVCVLGGNGSGKSTLAKHINALFVPDEGEVFVAGFDTSDEDNLFSVRSAVGLVFQNPDDQLIASVVEDDIAFGPENLGFPQEELAKRVKDSLQAVGLPGFEKHATVELSGGQRQRVAIAGVLAMKPKIAVFDEATAMLDPRGRTGLLKLCQSLHDKGMTVILITHFMDEAALADRVIVLDGGRIALQGTPREVFSQVDLLQSLHLDLPFAARLSLALRERGIDMKPQIDIGQLKEELCALRLRA